MVGFEQALGGGPPGLHDDVQGIEVMGLVLALAVEDGASGQARPAQHQSLTRQIAHRAAVEFGCQGGLRSFLAQIFVILGRPARNHPVGAVQGVGAVHQADPKGGQAPDAVPGP